MPVAGVVHHRVTNGRHVHANLMRSSGVKVEAQQRHGIGLGDARDDVVAGTRGTTVGAHRHHRRRARRTSDGRVHDPVLLGDVTLDHAEVGTFHQSLGQLGAQVDEPLGGLGDHEDARRALVQTMHDTWSQGVTEPAGREFAHLGVARQQSRDERAGTLAGPGMHDLARGLIDHAEILVIEHDVHDHAVVGFDFAAVGRGQDRDQMLTNLDVQRSLHDYFVIKRHRPARQHGARLRARQASQHRQHAIDANRVERDWHHQVEYLAVEGVNVRNVAQGTNNRSPRTAAMIRTTKPAVIAASARLKTGNEPTATKSVT